MANNGIDADKAANSLKTGLARLVAPAKEGAKMMDKLGISVTNSDGTMKSSIQIQKELHDAFGKLSESEQIAAASAIFGKTQMAPWLALINTAPEEVQELDLSHLVYCSDCGDLYRRTQWFLKGEHVPVWRCVSRIAKKTSGVDCPSRTLYEKDLHAAVITAFNQMIEQKDEFLPGMRLAMDRALVQNNSPRVAEIDVLREEKQALLRGVCFFCLRGRKVHRSVLYL